MKPGCLIYKCRKCGAIDKTLHAPDVLHALIRIEMGVQLPESWGALKPQMTGIHHCADKHIGITDLIGGEED